MTTLSATVSAEPTESEGTTLVLKGLELDNLLAFLALLGLLRALEAVHPEWLPRVAWRGMPPVALLSCRIVGLRETDVAKAVLAALPFFSDSFASFGAKTGLIPSNEETNRGASTNAVDDEAKKNKKIPEEERVNLLRQLIGRIHEDQQQYTTSTSPFDCGRTALDAVASLVRQTVEDGSYVVEDSPLKLPSGQQAFVGLIRQLVGGSTNASKRGNNAPLDEEQQISKALFSSWTYGHKRDSLRLSPQEDRRYAYRFGDPSPEGARTERGANLLAAIGLICVPLCPGDTDNPLVAYHGRRNIGVFSWPIWDEFASLAGILALLRHPELIARAPQLDPLRPFGVTGIMRCRRYVLPSGQGDYGNVSLAVQIV